MLVHEARHTVGIKFTASNLFFFGCVSSITGRCGEFGPLPVSGKAALKLVTINFKVNLGLTLNVVWIDLKASLD